MDGLTFKTSLASGPHHYLKQLCGSWKGTTKTYFEPEVLTDESQWEGNIRTILNGMFVQHDYTGSLQGKPLSGTAIYGYQISSNRFQCLWTDSFHNGTSMMFCEGSPNNSAFNVLGHYNTPDGSPPWGWRTEITMPAENNLVITMYNITPDGIEAVAVVTDYRRV
jgi:hypothetical protein